MQTIRGEAELRSTKRCLSLRSSSEGPGASPADVMGLGAVSKCPQVPEKWIFNRHVRARRQLRAGWLWGNSVCNDNKTPQVYEVLLLPGVWERIRAKEMRFILLSCASPPTVLLPEGFCSMSLCVLRCLGRGCRQRGAPALSCFCVPTAHGHMEFFSTFLLFWAFFPLFF